MASFKNKVCVSIIIAAVFFSNTAFAQEEIEYRKFKLEKVSCDSAIIYKHKPDGMDIGVSAIATGKGAEFRKWRVTDVKLHVGDERLKPDEEDRFYVKEESFFRIPAAILFAAIGTQINVSGTGLEQGIAKAGAAIGLGLLVLAAQGEITGGKYLFRLNKDMSEKIFDGKSFAEIRLEDADQHWQDTVRIGIAKPSFKSDNITVYNNMSRQELTRLMDELGSRVGALEKEQASYKYGADPEYDHIQSEIETLQTQRGVAYKAWFEKEEVNK